MRVRVVGIERHGLFKLLLGAHSVFHHVPRAALRQAAHDSALPDMEFGTFRILGDQRVGHGKGIGVLLRLEESLQLAERSVSGRRRQRRPRGQCSQIEAIDQDRRLSHQLGDQRRQVLNRTRSVSDVQTVHHEHDFPFRDGLQDLLKGRRLFFLLRERLDANLIALDDQDSERNHLTAHAAAETHHRSAAAKSELDLGEGNDRGIADSNGFSDHAADFQLRNQLVEVGQGLGQRSLGSRKQPREKEGNSQQNGFSYRCHDVLLTWRAS